MYTKIFLTLVRHGATDTSEALRKILNVTALGDRKDIAEKYNLLIERARTKRISRGRGHENEQQLEADKIGLFAMVAAGYDPAAFFSSFDRLTESGGKTGSWFSDLFGGIRPAEKRLREMLRATEQMPPACRDGRSAKATESFLKWQAGVVSFREAGRKEDLPGLIWKKELDPKLRSDISHFAFSQDGKLFLAQDDFAITIIEREPLRALFQIPAEKDFIHDKIIWSRDFPKEAPEFSFDDFSGRLILYWRLASDAGKDRLKEIPELQAKAGALGDRADDYLVEIIDAHTQKTVGMMLLETGKGSFDIGKGLSERDWIALRDSEDRVLLYSIKDGDLLHRFFGDHAAMNPANNQIAVENFPGEIMLYNLDTGDRQSTFVINGSAAFVRFNLGGNKLFILSDAQSVYAFDLNKLPAKAATQAK